MDGKTTYAQSSDIKSRTYLEYRKDMKKKVIVELELLSWLQRVVKSDFDDKTAKIKKGGGDAFIWFLRKGGITREPDYEVFGKNNFKIELQYGQEINKKSISEDLEKIWKIINFKLQVLDFQHQLIDITKDRLSFLLQQVVDEEKIVSIIPNNLESFFRICFILDNINKIPKNSSLWLIYLLSFISKKTTTEELYKILYCIDFLYSKIELKKNELDKLVEATMSCQKLLSKYEQNNGIYKSNIKISPIDEIRYALFSINLLEDLTQDIIHYYKIDKLSPIQKIYQTINDLEKIIKHINNQ
ncbi:hypothetical protein COX27_02135 [Candidatus Kuenenbacteria bacterium CG23_combo_of_CG06-09_8_20_14_all_36_9]|uniref:Uncharacterized protein n=1 Tax=Candidatus Kuenenbacteria bacterium CG10_big_fil_rev_8_21_14_0_10_36_11 TaxID=1974618 RepID=A0A2M6WAF3_9BACT|nr:MAG: hypothetical protein COX27_02135 [Candidatus Kuenenbacteria bacterium CG23_combo_of_CG06-09_8_20_14_all_36_9]PIT89731.1 MAG: hypothetical protein COU23_02510 [Candidatus Kuenenbacteria bacterium CG10_big_fil_rev_8_21_14_0_10_36_11]